MLCVSLLLARKIQKSWKPIYASRKILERSSSASKDRSVADAIADFVRSKHITQVVFGRALVRDWKKFLYLSIVHRFLRESPAVDVHIVTQEPESRLTVGSPAVEKVTHK